MPISPIDIQQKQFKTRPLGYEKGGVDSFLESLADETEKLNKQNQELKEELARTKAALEEMRGREATLKETLLTTQRMVDDLKNNARKEAEIIIADARLRADKIVHDAEERRFQLIDEIQGIKREKISFETGFRALLESHIRLLDLEVVPIQGNDRDEYLLEEPLPFDRGIEQAEKEDGGQEND